MEFDAEAARQWLLAVSAADRDQGWAQDAATGTFGSRIALADFGQDELDYFRRLAQQVRVGRRPEVETAIAIAGSSAQGKIQLFPGDADFFERVNIHAADEAAARAILAEAVRDTALRSMAEPDIVLLEVNFGVYPWPARHRGAARGAGESILWLPDEVLAGAVELETEAGERVTLRWDEVTAGLGWSYLGWMVADRRAGRIALASNMLDATWQAPDGRIVPLDGALDAFFQEIYLEAEALPVFTRLAHQVDPGAARAYADAMRWQVHHYTRAEPSYCKATTRLYNLFRLTDELEAAAYLRGLFDEPGAQLYQAEGLLEAALLARNPRSRLGPELVASQLDFVMETVAAAVDGPDERELLGALGALRDQVLSPDDAAGDWAAELRRVQARCRALVNEYFRVRLFGLPRIAAYLEAL